MTEANSLIPVPLASHQRVSAEILAQQMRTLLEHPFLSLILNAIQEMVIVTNDNRQIVFANQNALNFVGSSSLDEVIGLRPGDFLGCRNANTEHGCGTTRFCAYCGAARALNKAINGATATEECHIARSNVIRDFTLDLRVGSAPITLNATNFVVFTLVDISDQNRRRQLERIFFHDVLNTASIIQGTSAMIGDDYGCTQEVSELLKRSATRLVDQIGSQRELTEIENHEYIPTADTVRSKTLIQEILHEYTEHEVAKGKYLQLDRNTGECTFTVDHTLLARVLGNMIKNALEASDPSHIVTVGSTHDESHIEFWVHNPTVIPEAVQTQIFNRSFSTKGAGRGLGTYSMRLLSETYLEGSVNFVSREGAGTLFRARYPRTPSYAQEIAGDD